MTFLDNKGGSLKEGVSGSRGDAAIRSVRAKRESDEAGVWLRFKSKKHFLNSPHYRQGVQERRSLARDAKDSTL